MSLRVVVLALALILAAALLAILAYRDVPVESVVVDSGDGAEAAALSAEPAALSAEPALRRSEADSVSEAAGSTDFGVTEDELDEFKTTLLRSLNEEFRTSIDSSVETSWDPSTPEADESRREDLRQFLREPE